MKSICAMLRTKLYTLLLLTFAYSATAQYTINSPYSSYGLGERANAEHAIFSGMGNCSATVFDSTVLNFYNPSTYNTYGTGQPLFSIGIESKMLFQKDGAASVFSGTAMLNHYVMGIPLKKNFGIAFGLKPFARKGYELYDRIAVGTDSIKYTYLGKGGSQHVFVGASAYLINLKSFKWSVGGNAGYLFGIATNERRSQVIKLSQFSGGVDRNVLTTSAFYYELGTNMRLAINDKHALTLAGTFEPAQNLGVKKDEYLFYAPNVNDPRFYDTLYQATGVRGTIRMAPSYTVGLSYTLGFESEKKGNRIRESELALHVNYSMTDWSAYRDDLNPQLTFLNSSRINVGVQFIPERDFIDKAAVVGFFETVRYRAGYYQYTLPYSFNGTQMKDFGMTFGFGIPILTTKSLSSVNLGVSLGKRETGSTNSLNQKYIGLNFGVTLAPSNFDRWFRKRKLD
jgi:hypothetical protein